MAVNGVQNGPVDWGQVVKELSDKMKTENPDVDPSIVLDGNNLIFTATDARTGAVRTETIELPELDKPLEEMSDEEISQYLEAFASTLDDAIADLEAFIQSIKNAGAPGTGGKGRGENQTIDHTHGKHNSSGAQKTFFDLYALLNLMQQIAQEMRDNAREIRWDQLETQTASIKSQAGHQRHAAVLGAIVGGLTCLVQVGMLGYSGYKAGMAEKAASDTSANQQLTTSRNDLETLNMSDDPQKLDDRVSKLGSKLSTEQRNAVDAAFDDPEVTEACKKFETAKHNVEVAEDELKAQGELSGSFEKEIGDVQGQIDGLMGDLGESLGDGGLAHARLTDEDGVVFGLAGENTDDVADLAVPADDRIQLILPGPLHKIGAILCQRVVGALRVVSGDGGGLDLGKLCRECGLRDVVLRENALDGRSGSGKNADHHVLHGHILIAGGFGGLFRGAEDPVCVIGQVDLKIPGDPGQSGNGRVQLREEGIAVHAHAGEKGGYEPAVLIDEGVKDMLRGHIVIAVFLGHGLGRLHRFQCFLRKILCVQMKISFRRVICAPAN